MSTYKTYALVRTNKKGQRELEILRPVSGEVSIASGTIKRNLNEVKVGLNKFEVGSVVVAHFFLGGKYEKLNFVTSVERYIEMNVVLGIRSTARLSNETLKKVEEIYSGAAAVIGLAAEASAISKCMQFAPLPMPEDKAKEIMAILPFPCEIKPAAAGNTKEIHVPPAPAVEKEEKAGYYYVAPDANLFLSAAVNTLKAFGGTNNSVAVALLGASGYGKTSLAKMLAKKLGYQCVRLNCALITEPEEIAVKRGLLNGNTVTELRHFAKVLMAGKAVIVLDELTRAFPNILNSLFALLDGEGSEDFLGQVVTVGENVIFVATMNVGSEYTGTFKADLALKNRFLGWITVGAMPAAEEVRVLRSQYGIAAEDAKTIVQTANDFRRAHSEIVEVSTRTTLAVAMFVKAGLSVRQAFETVVVQSVDNDDKKTVVDFINLKLGTMSVAPNFKLLL